MPLYMKDGKAVFHIHVPKTGGTSLHAFFKQNGFAHDYFQPPISEQVGKYRRCTPQHMCAEQIKSILRPSQFDFLFMTVRDPLKRCVSEYKMRSRKGRELETIHVWFERMLGLYKVNPYISDNHIRPQAEFWLPGCEIFRQEDGYEDALFDRIEQATGVKLEDRRLGKRNATSRLVVDPADIAQVKPLVRDFYKVDYDKFGY